MAGKNAEHAFRREGDARPVMRLHLGDGHEDVRGDGGLRQVERVEPCGRSTVGDAHHFIRTKIDEFKIRFAKQWRQAAAIAARRP